MKLFFAFGVLFAYSAKPERHKIRETCKCILTKASAANRLTNRGSGEYRLTNRGSDEYRLTNRGSGEYRLTNRGSDEYRLTISKA
jgi:hypothetical protein